MRPEQANLLQATLDLLILKSLIACEMHGLGVSRRIQQITSGTFVVKPGSLFPALHRMEEEGWIPRSGASPRTTAAQNTTDCLRRD